MLDKLKGNAKNIVLTLLTAVLLYFGYNLYVSESGDISITPIEEADTASGTAEIPITIDSVVDTVIIDPNPEIGLPLQ